MKTSVPRLAIMASFLFVTHLTGIAKPILPHLVKQITPAGDNTGCFVEFTDGSIKQYGSLKLVTGLFKTPHLVADDSIIVNASGIKAYQNENGYAVSQKEFSEGHKSNVSKSALPGFALRVVKGYINLYSLKFYNGHNTTEKFYVQNGPDGQIIPYTPEILSDLLKENPDAVYMINLKNKEQLISKRLIAAVELFNNSKMISKN
jgi:hypothetical protein